MSGFDKARPLPSTRAAMPSASTAGRGVGELLKDNSLSLVMFVLFLVFLVGMSVTGWMEYNQDAKEHGEQVVRYGQYLLTGHFFEATFENWESEFFQMAAYVALTACLIQRGSAESKDPDKEEPQEKDPREERDNPEAPGPVRRGGFGLLVYQNSLSLALAGLCLFSFFGHAAAGAKEYSQEQIAHGEEAVGMFAYMGTSRFWFESFQNWQSEFLAVFVLVVLSIWLRQKGSPESKPVAAAHSETGT